MDQKDVSSADSYIFVSKKASPSLLVLFHVLILLDFYVSDKLPTPRKRCSINVHIEIWNE